MKTERNKQLGREAFELARKVLASNEKPLWAWNEFVAKDCYRNPKRPNWTEALCGINAKLVVNTFLLEMVYGE